MLPLKRKERMMSDTFREVDMQAEFLRGEEGGLRLAAAILRDQASALWNNRQDTEAAFVRGLADKVAASADRTEEKYRQALMAAEAKGESDDT